LSIYHSLKITAVNLNVELHPKPEIIQLKDSYILTTQKNLLIHTYKRIDSINNFGRSTFEGGATANKQYIEYGLCIYILICCNSCDSI
jgi:hypothetical protein